jgi:hypothetical protein
MRPLCDSQQTNNHPTTRGCWPAGHGWSTRDGCLRGCGRLNPCGRVRPADNPHDGCWPVTRPVVGCWVLVLLNSVSVVIAVGKRPVSFRTRKLSLPAPMVLHLGGCGRVGRRRTQREEMAHPGHTPGWAISASTPFYRSPLGHTPAKPTEPGNAYRPRPHVTRADIPPWSARGSVHT